MIATPIDMVMISQSANRTVLQEQQDPMDWWTVGQYIKVVRYIAVAYM